MCDVKMSVKGGGHVNTANVLVVKGVHAAMLGRKTAEQLGVLRVGLAEHVYTTDVSTKETSREMTEEQQRLPKEAFKKKKEDVLMHKLPKEEKAAHSNMNKFNHQWRNIMRESKANELKKDIEILSQTFERVVDRKESVIKSLVKDLLESEEHYFMALRSHLQNIDKLADFQTERLRQLKMKFANEQKTLIFEFDTEREMLVQQNQGEITELQDMIIAMKQNFAARQNEAKNEFQSIREELKNIEAKHALGVQLETAMDEVWAQFPFIVRNQETTEERNKSFEELNSKDEKIAMVSDIEVGDRVILSQSKWNKLTTRFEREPYDVVARDGNAVVIQRGEEPRKMRNIALEEAEWLPRDITRTDDDVHSCGKQRRGARTNRVHFCQCGNQWWRAWSKVLCPILSLLKAVVESARQLYQSRLLFR